MRRGVRVKAGGGAGRMRRNEGGSPVGHCKSETARLVSRIPIFCLLNWKLKSLVSDPRSLRACNTSAMGMADAREPSRERDSCHTRRRPRHGPGAGHTSAQQSKSPPCLAAAPTHTLRSALAAKPGPHRRSLPLGPVLSRPAPARTMRNSLAHRSPTQRRHPPNAPSRRRLPQTREPRRTIICPKGALRPPRVPAPTAHKTKTPLVVASLHSQRQQRRAQRKALTSEWGDTAAPAPAPLPLSRAVTAVASGVPPKRGHRRTARCARLALRHPRRAEQRRVTSGRRPGQRGSWPPGSRSFRTPGKPG
mmetsp:Transcript_33742/g.84407  ORF Transcript_33742/g.84407 Transcript_33742/m.84407 type:complete len:306 (-) Transcript_33742:130-1047(-)